MTNHLEQIRTHLATNLESSDIDLPVLPQVATEVLQLTTDSRVDAAKLSGLIHKDQALAGHILKIANSVAYCGRVPIVSLQQAVARLGMNLIGEIAFAACVRNRVFHLPGHEREMRELWRHSIASGAYAKEIARLLRRNVEGAFLCGLLHNVGKPIVLQVVADVEKDLGETVAYEEAIELMNEFHLPYGRLLGEKWELPDSVQEAIIHYGAYAEAESFVEEAKITCLADRLGTYVAVVDIYDEESVRHHPVYEALNLYQDDVDDLLGMKENVLEVVDSMAL